MFNLDGFAKSPSAASRFILALLNSRCARRRLSRCNRVKLCSVLPCTLHSARLVRLRRIRAPCPCGGRDCAVYLGDFLWSHQSSPVQGDVCVNV